MCPFIEIIKAIAIVWNKDIKPTHTTASFTYHIIWFKKMNTRLEYVIRKILHLSDVLCSLGKLL